MNSDQIKVIREEIERQIEQIEFTRTLSESSFWGNNRLVAYMNASTASKEFFSNLNEEDLLVKYEEELARVTEVLGNSGFSCNQKILNFLEYIRLNGMYENIDINTFPMPKHVAAISKSGLNVALLGKGVCASQASFLRDLLITSGELSRTSQISFINNEGISEDEHLIAYTTNSENETYFLDPTWYNGTVKSIEGSLNSARIPEETRNQLTPLNVTQEEIEEARSNALEYLIERYQIRDLSEQLEIKEVSDLEKQIRILAFIEKNIAPASEKLKCRSVVIGEREIEVGKLLELFYKANDIPYTLQCSGDKYLSDYITNIDGQECTISPRVAFDRSRNDNPLTRVLHFITSEQGDKQYLWQVSKEKEEKIKTMIIESRKIAEGVVFRTKTIDEESKTSRRQFVESLRVEVTPVSITEKSSNITEQEVDIKSEGPTIDEL